LFQDLIISLLSAAVVEPLQTELADKLEAARAPQAVMVQISQCASAAAPVLAERVASDPWWGVATTAKIWTGITSPEAVVGDAAPPCASALQSARPFLE